MRFIQDAACLLMPDIVLPALEQFISFPVFLV